MPNTIIYPNTDKTEKIDTQNFIDTILWKLPQKVRHELFGDSPDKEILKSGAIAVTILATICTLLGILSGWKEDTATPWSTNTDSTTLIEVPVSFPNSATGTPSANVATVEDIATWDSKWWNKQDDINALLTALNNDTTNAETGTINLETVQEQNKKAFEALFTPSTDWWYQSKDGKTIDELAKTIGLWGAEAFDKAIVYIQTNFKGKNFNFWAWESTLTPEQQRQFKKKWRVKRWETFVWEGSNEEGSNEFVAL